MGYRPFFVFCLPITIGMIFQYGTNQYKGYKFTYDGLNRLRQGDYGNYTSSWINVNNFDLSSVQYDANGNITLMNCKSSSGADRENLVYSYSGGNTGNQLVSVSGTCNGVSGRNGSFTYDSNGNVTSDGLRGIGSISWFDEVNRPKQYYKDAANKVDYSYDALGNKWGKTSVIASTTAATLYYGPFIYTGGTLTRVLTPEGYYNPATGNYYYYLKDHLGNNRITYHYSGSAPVIDQEVEYYPFGSMFTANNLQNNLYLYNGKELNNEFFENYDYGKRFYDPQIGRFPSLDPLSDKFVNLSPYNYASNNPVTNIDLWGLQGIGVNFITDLMLLGSKYKSIISEAKAPAQRLLTGQTSLSNMPNEVTSQMGTQTKSMISTTSKLNDVNKVKQTGTKLISEVGLDVGKTAEKTGDALTGLGFAAAPFKEGASLALVPIGEQVSSAGLALQSGINYANGNFKESAGQVTVVGVSLLTNTLVGEAVAQSKKVGAITTVKEGRTQEGILNFIGNLFGKTTEVAVDRDKYKNK